MLKEKSIGALFPTSLSSKEDTLWTWDDQCEKMARSNFFKILIFSKFYFIWMY